MKSFIHGFSLFFIIYMNGGFAASIYFKKNIFDITWRLIRWPIVFVAINLRTNCLVFDRNLFKDCNAIYITRNTTTSVHGFSMVAKNKDKKTINTIIFLNNAEDEYNFTNSGSIEVIVPAKSNPNYFFLKNLVKEDSKKKEDLVTVIKNINNAELVLPCFQTSLTDITLIVHRMVLLAELLHNNRLAMYTANLIGYKVNHMLEENDMRLRDEKIYIMGRYKTNEPGFIAK
jgi:hypothetical protein